MSRRAIVEHGDCLELMAEMEPASVDAVVTDPPYGLQFMGREWDHGVPHALIWAEVLRVAKPGAYLLAFGGTRKFHRLACAIEDAGWEIQDCLGWIYGQGFPKHAAALKPAWEPIVLARAPLAGTLAATIEAHGTGVLGIDACRVEAEPRPVMVRTETVVQARSMSGPSSGARPSGIFTTNGRWPANVVHDGSPEVLEVFPDTPGQLAGTNGSEPSASTCNALGIYYKRAAHAPRGDTGSAARFFYCAKASPADRHDGLERGANHHPTVKPTDLMRWLCRLVTPPGGLILDPFCGSGSTGRAAVLEGRRFLGMEREADYVTIARQRIAAATPAPTLFD